MENRWNKHITFNQEDNQKFDVIKAPTGNTMAVPQPNKIDIPQGNLFDPMTGESMSFDPMTGESMSNNAQSLGNFKDFYQDNEAMIGNVIGGGTMALGNMMASRSLENAMGDIDEAIEGTSDLITDNITETGTTIDNLNTQLSQMSSSATDNMNARLESNFDKINKQKSNIGGGMLTRQKNQVRRTLSDALDNTIRNYRSKTDASIDMAYGNYRDGVRRIEGIKEQLRAKKAELAEQNRKAKTGAVLGVLSVGADLLLPGSGQVIRTGAKAYQNYG